VAAGGVIQYPRRAKMAQASERALTEATPTPGNTLLNHGLWARTLEHDAKGVLFIPAQGEAKRSPGLRIPQIHDER
jgi:hypothetical protein